MAGFSGVDGTLVRVLDAGAGVGILSAAWVGRACEQAERPDTIQLTAYEIDEDLIPALGRVLDHARKFASDRGVEFRYEIRQRNFVEDAVSHLDDGLFTDSDWPAFDVAILNPPYKKFRTDSPERALLRQVGLETSNLYAAFVSLALRGVRDGGEVIAITPRSFCNGPYFATFRRDLFRLGSLTHLHVFETRDSAFGEDEVLQENVIYRIQRAGEQAPSVVIEWSAAGEAQNTTRREVPFEQVVRATDGGAFIHIAPDAWDAQIANIVRSLQGSLNTLGLAVSTGRVVEFRAREYLRAEPEPGTVPLIYPMHNESGRVLWPRPGAKKANALALTPETQSLVNPEGVYVLVKRFSSKEEARRVVAFVCTPEMAPGAFVAFENHLNYFHANGAGLQHTLALGLAAFLNSTIVDAYFRQFSGHTQVNATDLRSLHYPTADQIARIGSRLGAGVASQQDIDNAVEDELVSQPEDGAETSQNKRKIEEAATILHALGLPREQTNERAALTLLALLNLPPERAWSEASSPMMGVTPLMEFAATHYGKRWKPNTRETVRRRTLHQFRDAGLVVANPDKLDRPVNSPDYCYQVPREAVALVRSFGTPSWRDALAAYLALIPSLANQYSRKRDMARIALTIGEGRQVSLSPGGQNDLIRQIWDEFCSRFTPGGNLLYIGDADAKWREFNEEGFRALGVELDPHGKMPDVIVHYVARNWLILIEAVTSHGPVDEKRRRELRGLFEKSSAPLVYVTAFETRQAMNRFLPEIAWETEVWVAESPEHMIHFNGERFLGPYE